MHWNEIKTINEFYKCKTCGYGYIVITDKASGNRIHSTDCPDVDVVYFTEKVIENKAANGQYFWVENSKLAHQKWNVVDCVHCKK